MMPQAPDSGRTIGVPLFGFVLKLLDDLDMKAPLGALRVDSLVSIESKNWCRQKLAIESAG